MLTTSRILLLPVLFNMIAPKVFHDALIKNGVSFFVGVPDSLLKSFALYLDDHASKDCHIVAANEGNAVAIATGWHLATSEIPLVYMQNAGEGNAINPLVSLADKSVYGIPMLLLVGWRGEPGVEDEPQHMHQGAVTTQLLETLGILYEVLPDNSDAMQKTIARLVGYARAKNIPVALVVKKNTFEVYRSERVLVAENLPVREKALAALISFLTPRDVVVSTTGMISRELFELRKDHDHDFLNVGAMGHASSIAFGVAKAKPKRRIFCIDGDGALLMHMGALAVIGNEAPKNFLHIVFNNGAHDSVGGQATAAFHTDLCRVAIACGYTVALRAKSLDEIKARMPELLAAMGPAFLEVRVAQGARDNLSRPPKDLGALKKLFMKFLQKHE